MADGKLRSTLKPMGDALFPRGDIKKVGRQLGHLGTAAAVVALALYLAGALLRVRSGHGLEDFLGWTAARDEGAVGAIIQVWAQSPRLWVAYLDLGLDSAAFVPLYVMLLLSWAEILTEARRRKGTTVRERLPFLVLAVPVVALAVVDLVENGFGLAHLGNLGLAVAVLAPAAGLGWLWWLDRTRKLLPRVGWWGLGAGLVVGLGFASAGFLRGTACRLDSGSSIWQLGCAAHRAKGWLAVTSVLFVAISAASWVFGGHLRLAVSPDEWKQASEAERQKKLTPLRAERARFRAALWDVMGRSRYVLLALALVYGLFVRMDQGRDVVYAVASAAFAKGAGAWAVFGTVVACLATAIAVWLLMFSCWLWARSVCQLQAPGSAPIGEAAKEHGASPERRTEEGDASPDAPEDVLARYWARALASIPAVLLVMLCAGTIQDIVTAPSAVTTTTIHWLRPVLVVMALGVLTVGVGLAFLAGRSHAPAPSAESAGARARKPGYYNCLSLREWGELVGLKRGTSASDEKNAEKKDEEKEARWKKYRIGPLTPRWLPWFLCGFMLLLRALDVFTGGRWSESSFPTTALAVVLLAVALWLCLFGWLSILEVHKSVPAVIMLVVLVGLLGLVGATDNHVVWSSVNPGPVPTATGSGLRMLGFTVLIAALILWAYWRVIAIAERKLYEGRTPPRWRTWLEVAAFAILCAGVLKTGDRLATSRRPAEPSTPLMGTEHDLRLTLDAALAGWLRQLRATEGARPQDGAIPVYLVSSEGGGIRAAAWTAFTLEQLATKDRFLDRTFSISGVSGGAVGAAVFRACHASCHPDECLTHFARTNLLGPLLSAWTFEDGLARVIPTSLVCATPGCGFMSRAAWFEQALESAAVDPDAREKSKSPCASSFGMREGLFASREALPGDGRFMPYLLLNATWVESGERAVASDLRIDSGPFGGARDQLAASGQDLTLATAAHNAARFPYINAIGALRGPRWLCQARAWPAQPPQDPVDPGYTVEICGHLADGGYFDNSGDQSTLDVLHGLSRCLEVTARDLDAKQFPECLKLADDRDWLRKRLFPQVLMVRNGGERDSEVGAPCPPAQDQTIPRPGDILSKPRPLVPPPPPRCLDQTRRYAPGRPACNPADGVFVDVLAPPLTALKAIGTGAGGRLAEARLETAVLALRAQLEKWRDPPRVESKAVDPELAKTLEDFPPIQVIDLVPDGVRYPLGWHLSDLAVEGIKDQAGECKLPKGPPPLAQSGSVTTTSDRAGSAP
jgi:hypothetical protein